MTVGAGNVPDFRLKIIPRGKPFYRTAIVAYTSGVVASYCDGVIQVNGTLGQAQRPQLSSQPQITGQ